MMPRVRSPVYLDALDIAAAAAFGWSADAPTTIAPASLRRRQRRAVSKQADAVTAAVVSASLMAWLLRDGGAGTVAEDGSQIAGRDESKMRISWRTGAPDSATFWNITATLFAALIAAGAALLAAWWAARSTMKNARDLQDRERRLESQSVAALLSADLHKKLITLALLLREPPAEQVHELTTMGANMKAVLDASLPKLGGLGHQAAQLLAAFDGLSLLAHDARRGGQAGQDLTARMRAVAMHIGSILGTLWDLYELDRPKPLEDAGIDLGAAGLGQLKDLGL